jgi:hypothetical protein
MRHLTLTSPVAFNHTLAETDKRQDPREFYASERDQDVREGSSSSSAPAATAHLSSSQLHDVQ